MDSGSYRLFLRLDKALTLQIGALGRFDFKPGIYVYTGSAMRNLSKRIERHKRRRKTKHWHIDYLTSNTNFKIIKTEIFPSEKKEECQKNMEVVSLAAAEIPVKKFGSSDCSTCPAHLVYFKDTNIFNA
jgi:sugar fermentation stimulation protein A